MSVETSSLYRNRLLQQLPANDLARLHGLLQTVPLHHKQVLHQQNAPVDYVYFIEGGMVSVVTILTDGMQVEVGVAGREGMVGISAALGAQRSALENAVQIPGTAHRMPAHLLRSEMAENSKFRDVLLRYADDFLAMASRAVACNARHTLEQRLARWLLTAHDRTTDDQLPLTHEFLAMMLGARRPGVSIAASALQKAGLIQYSYGRVTVLDRPGLERTACECYGLVAAQFAHAPQS